MAYIDLGLDETRYPGITGLLAYRPETAHPAARADGATDVEVHDTVLIAAVFCMINRYVDGLGTLAPDDPSLYKASVPAIVANGYSTGSQRRR